MFDQLKEVTKEFKKEIKILKLIRPDYMMSVRNLPLK